MQLTAEDIVYRPPFLMDREHVERLDLFDAMYVRDNKQLPVRMRMAVRQCEAWACVGRGLVVDLGFTAETRDSLTVVESLLRLNLHVENMLYEHARAVDEYGYLSVGYLQAVLDSMHRHRSQSFDLTTLYQLMRYNTPHYFNHVTYLLSSVPPPGRSAAVLGSKLGVDTLAAAVHVQLHDVLSLAEAQVRIRETLAQSAVALHAAIVGGAAASGAHHFLVLWGRTRTGTDPVLPPSAPPSPPYSPSDVDMTPPPSPPPPPIDPTSVESWVEGWRLILTKHLDGKTAQRSQVRLPYFAIYFLLSPYLPYVNATVGHKCGSIAMFRGNVPPAA